MGNSWRFGGDVGSSGSRVSEYALKKLSSAKSRKREGLTKFNNDCCCDGRRKTFLKEVIVRVGDPTWD